MKYNMGKGKFVGAIPTRKDVEILCTCYCEICKSEGSTKEMAPVYTDKNKITIGAQFMHLPRYLCKECSKHENFYRDLDLI